MCFSFKTFEFSQEVEFKLFNFNALNNKVSSVEEEMESEQQVDFWAADPETGETLIMRACARGRWSGRWS